MTEKDFFKVLAQKFGYTNVRIQLEMPGTCCYELALTKKNKKVGAIGFKKYTEDVDDKNYLPNSVYCCGDSKEAKDNLLKRLAHKCIDGTFDRIYLVDHAYEGLIIHQTCRCVSKGIFTNYEDIILNAKELNFNFQTHRWP